MVLFTRLRLFHASQSRSGLGRPFSGAFSIPRDISRKVRETKVIGFAKRALSPADPGRLRAGDPEELLRMQPEDHVGVSGRGPYFVLLEQILVEDGRRLATGDDRRHTADGEASLPAHEVGVRLLELFSEERRHPLLVHPVRPTGED